MPTSAVEFTLNFNARSQGLFNRRAAGKVHGTAAAAPWQRISLCNATSKRHEQAIGQAASSDNCRVACSAGRYRRQPDFKVVSEPENLVTWPEGQNMSSERTGTILGVIVAAAALAAAFIYVPVGSSTMAAKPAAAPQVPMAPVAPAAPRGPVVREVPN
jgi:hypothetical protein